MTEPRYDDLKALFINCTLKRSPEISNTQGLVDLRARETIISVRSGVSCAGWSWQ
jgi:hypothetical protein